MQPGQTITPGGAVQPPEPPQTQAPPETPSPAPSVSPPAESPVTQQPSSPDDNPGWKVSTDETVASRPAQADYNMDASVSWSASEYVEHQKNLGWFVGLGFVIAVLAIGIYLFNHDLFSPIMVAICGVFFGIFAARQPRVLQYTVNHDGLTIGDKLYTYDRFKSFSVVDEGHLRSILLMPLQRFMPPLTVYYDPADEDQIMDVLSMYLPFAEAPPDSVDRLMRRVRF